MEETSSDFRLQGLKLRTDVRHLKASDGEVGEVELPLGVESCWAGLGADEGRTADKGREECLQLTEVCGGWHEVGAVVVEHGGQGLLGDVYATKESELLCRPVGDAPLYGSDDGGEHEVGAYFGVGTNLNSKVADGRSTGEEGDGALGWGRWWLSS